MKTREHLLKNFHSTDMGVWKRYFENNRAERMPIPWERELQIEEFKREPLIRSLQRFQIGESGEGAHLKRCAATTGDADYAQAIELFIAEEQEHARLLSLLLEKLSAPLLRGHWSDLCFIVVRRFAGLKTELMTLLVAEIIAQHYYQVLYEGTHDDTLRTICAQILHDEDGHVAFHCDYLKGVFGARSEVVRGVTLLLWSILFRVVARLVALDHRGVLRAMGTTPGNFIRDCDYLFDKTAASIFDRNVKSVAAQV